MQYFGLKIKNLRLSRDLTQQELAEKMDVTRSSIGAYETGSQYPSIEVLKKLASFFNVSSDYLLGLSEEQRYETSRLTDEQNLLILQMIDQFHYLNNQIKN